MGISSDRGTNKSNRGFITQCPFAQLPHSEQDASCARSLAWLGAVCRAGPAVDAARQIILVLAALTAGL